MDAGFFSMGLFSSKKSAHRGTIECAGLFLRLFAVIIISTLCCPPSMAQNAVPAFSAPDQEEAPAPSEITAEPIPDQRLENRLNAIFSQIPDFENFKAAVEEGVVRLTGKAESLSDVQEAKALTQRLEGVVFVVSDIRIQPEIEIRFAPVLRKAYSAADRIVRFLPLVFLALLIVTVFWLLARMIKQWDWLFTHLSSNRLMQYFLRQLVSHLFVLIGILVGLYVLDLTAVVGAIIGAAGLIGLVLGFAFRDIAENYLAGFLLSSRSLFSVGDRIDVVGYEGKVVRMTMRELILMTYEGNHVRIPNSEVFKSVTVNYSRNPQRECNFTVDIDNSEDLDHVRQVGCAALAGMTGVIDDPEPFMRVEEFGAYAMTVRFHLWVDQRAYSFRKVRSEAKRILKIALDEAGVKMPPPLREITLREEAKEKGDVSVEKHPQISAAEAARRVDVTPEEHIKRQIDEEIVRSI